MFESRTKSPRCRCTMFFLTFTLICGLSAGCGNTGQDELKDTAARPIVIDAAFFGAGSSGSRDDTDSIASALAFLKSTGGTLRLTGPLYTVRGDIRLYSGTTVEMSANTRVVLAPEAECNFIFGGEGAINVKIAGGILDGNKRKRAKPLLAALYSWNGSQDWVIDGVRVIDSSGHGIFMNGGGGYTIKGVEVVGSEGIGIAVFKSPGDIRVEDSAVRDGSFIGMQIAGTAGAPTSGVWITGTEVTGSKNSNLALNHVDGGAISRSKFNASRTQFGLLCDHCSHLVLSDSEFNGNVAGILLNYASSWNTVRDNLLEGNREDGLDIALDGGTGNVIAFNIVRGNGIWGVYLLDAIENIVEGNTFDTNGGLATASKTHGAAVQIAGESSGNIITLNRFLDRKGDQQYRVYEGPSARGLNRVELD